MSTTTQPILVHTSKPETVRPLLQAAMDWEMNSLRYGLKKTDDRLKAFESQYGMSSEEFERRLVSGELEENLDAIDWRMEIQMKRLLEEQFGALMEAEIAE